jgi:hypothetical protein
MKELDQNITVDPARLTGASSESAILKQLSGIINMDGVGEDDGPNGFSVPPKDSIPTADQQQVTAPLIAKPVAALAPKRQLPSNIFLTGRMKVGKDFILQTLGYVIHGFADPLYKIQSYFFLGADKQTPGARTFLQKVGQWGRGIKNDSYPISTERAVFETLMRAAGPLIDTSVRWEAFGRSDLIWVNALLHRIATKGIEEKTEKVEGVGVSNVRFENEMKTLAEAGMKHFHVMCSPETWSKRLRESGLTPQSPAVSDLSEKLAVFMDDDALKHARLKPNGGKLAVNWNDPGVRCPSRRT